VKTAFLMGEKTLDTVFNQKALDYFYSLGEVSFNTGSLPTAKENIISAIKNADIAITSWGNTSLGGDILSACPALRLVAHAAGSVKPVVSDELWEKNIKVLSSACPLGEGVAETALGFTISACKNFYNVNSHIHAGEWNKGREDIRELFDLNIGVIGSGWAGRHYIRLLKNFHVNILCYDPFVSKEDLLALGAKKAELTELLKNSDVVSIHAPSIPATRHMINRETLALMKKSAVLINTARGTIIDEAALFEHMAAGNLKYACLDVFDPEPPSVENPLFGLENVIATPHLAGLAQNGLKRIGMFVREETEKFLKGLPMRGEVTKEMLANMA